MSRACSVSQRRPFGVARLCQEWGILRSTFCARRHSGAQRGVEAHRKRRPGAPPRLSDEQLHQEIRALIQGSEFTGEGHRKV